MYLTPRNIINSHKSHMKITRQTILHSLLGHDNMFT